jgi:hypothetical protein
LISLTELFCRILNEGAIDLALLLGSAQHLHPSHFSAAISVEDAGLLLSQRHASRPGDEVVIWELLNCLKGENSAINLWKSQRCIRTGFLMSSAPRIESAGYRWAPSAPSIRPQLRTVSLNDDQSSDQQHYMVCYQPYGGGGSYIAGNIDGGLQGKWLVQDMNASLLAGYREGFCFKTPLGTGHPTQQELNPYIDEMVEVYSSRIRHLLAIRLKVF